jgi:hypothetical protein
MGTFSVRGYRIRNFKAVMYFDPDAYPGKQTAGLSAAPPPIASVEMTIHFQVHFKCDLV